jgi:hypothetical protein
MAVRRVKSGRKVTLKPSKQVSIKVGGKAQRKGFALSVRRVVQKNKVGAKFALVVKKGKSVRRFWLCKRTKCVRGGRNKVTKTQKLLKLRVKASVKARSVNINGFVIKFKSLKSLLKLLVLLGLKKAAAAVRRLLKAKKTTKKTTKKARKAGAKKSKKTKKTKKSKKTTKKSKKAKKTSKKSKKSKKAKKTTKKRSLKFRGFKAVGGQRFRSGGFDMGFVRKK